MELSILFTVVGIAISWPVCSVIVYKGTLAYFQGQFPMITPEGKRRGWARHKRFAKRMAAGGPLSLMVVVFASGFFRYGFSAKEPESAQRDSEED